jgi:hypothetical protein
MATCEDCRYWTKDDELTHGEQKGRCHLSPPVPMCREPYDWHWEQPHTYPDEHCNEWKQA